MRRPRVAVVIPVYNAQATLLEALISVDRQSFRDFVIIAVNDGSTDGSLKLLQEFAATRDNVTVLAQDNHGVSYSRNRGIRYAKEHAIPFIAFIDADDVWHKDKLTWQMKSFARYPDTDLVIVRQADYERMSDAPAIAFDETRVRPFDDLFETLCLNDFTFHPASYLAKSEAFRNSCFYDERFSSGEDFPLFFYFGYEDRKTLYIDVPLYFQRYSPNSLQRRKCSAYHGYRGRVTVIEELLSSSHSDPRMTAARVSVLLAAKDKYLPGMTHGARRCLPYSQALLITTRTFSRFRNKRAFLVEFYKTALWPLARWARGRAAEGAHRA